MQEELVKKLRYKSGRAAVISAPDGYRLGIEDDAPLDGTYDFVQLFVMNADEVLEWVPKVIPLLNDDALFWVTYPKSSSKIKTNVNRDSLWKLVEGKTPYRPVSNIAIDETWSALRFRHQDKVKSKA